MPGIPLVDREAVDCICNCIYSRGTDHMCCQDCGTHLSAEEQIAAEQSLAIYCKPVELYNILQRRAAGSPYILQRCLRYKIEAKHKRRIEMKISLPSTFNDASRVQCLFPICVLLARPVYSPAGIEDSTLYQFKRECILKKCAGDNETNQHQAKFVLPSIHRLSTEVKSGSLSLLFVSCAELFKERVDLSVFPENIGGPCFLGKVPMELLHLSWGKSHNLSCGERAEMLPTVDLRPSFLKTGYFGEEKCFSFHGLHSGLMGLQQIQVCIVAEELGAKQRSPYNYSSCNGVPSTMLPHISSLRNGNVIFNYKYYNDKLQRTEVTEDFTCPFCLVKCASFKGLRWHLRSFHDLFNFEFWVTEEFQAVNVSVKSDIWRSEVVSASVDPKLQTFSFCTKAVRRRKLKRHNQKSNHVHPLVFDSDLPGYINEIREKTNDIQDQDASITRISSATARSYADPECIQSMTESNLAPPTLLQFAKTRNLSAERTDPRSRALLLKKQFFHSHKAQPMAPEQVLSDGDSEDEFDDDVADLEDRRMLDDFVDVTKDEKLLMHLWNSFVRKQRVLADGHIPWACEAFSKLHGRDLVRTPALLWCWRLFMIKLWNHGLLDARAMNNCNIIIEQIERQPGGGGGGEDP